MQLKWEFSLITLNCSEIYCTTTSNNTAEFVKIRAFRTSIQNGSNFGDGPGEIEAEATDPLVAIQVYLGRNFTVYLSNRSFAVGSGDTLKIKRYSSDDLESKL